MIIVNDIFSLAYTRHSCVSVLELQQNNLCNPEAYLEHFQASKMKYFAKIVNTESC